MRHRVYGKKLGRNKNERTALFKSLVQSLFTYGTIETSESKAKAIKGLVDKIINLAKSKNTQQLLQAYFVNKDLRERVIKEVAPKLSDRTSGYTTLLKIGAREGDRTMVVRMSLIHNEQLSSIIAVKGPEKKVKEEKTQETSKKVLKAESKKKIENTKPKAKTAKKGAK